MNLAVFEHEPSELSTHLHRYWLRVDTLCGMHMPECVVLLHMPVGIR